MTQSTFLLEEPPVSHSQSQDSEEEWQIAAVTCPLNSLNLLNASAPSGWFGDTAISDLTVRRIA